LLFPAGELVSELSDDLAIDFLDLGFEPATGSVAVGTDVPGGELVSFDNVSVFFVADFAFTFAFETGPEVVTGGELVVSEGESTSGDDPLSDASMSELRSFREPAHGNIILTKWPSASGTTHFGMNMKT